MELTFSVIASIVAVVLFVVVVLQQTKITAQRKDVDVATARFRIGCDDTATWRTKYEKANIVAETYKEGLLTLIARLQLNLIYSKGRCIATKHQNILSALDSAFTRSEFVIDLIHGKSKLPEGMSLHTEILDTIDACKVALDLATIVHSPGHAVIEAAKEKANGTT